MAGRGGNPTSQDTIQERKYIQLCGRDTEAHKCFMHAYFFQYCFSPFIVNWFIDKSFLMKEPETGNKKTSALFPASDSCLNVNPDLSTLNSEVTHPLHYSFSQKILTEIQSGSNQPDSVHKCNLWEHRPKRTEILPWPQRRMPSHLGGKHVHTIPPQPTFQHCSQTTEFDQGWIFLRGFVMKDFSYLIFIMCLILKKFALMPK